VAKRAGFILRLVVCALGVGAGHARADTPPAPAVIAGGVLGTRWMGLSVPGVGIHGSDEPWSIGQLESHGCIRMQVASAEWLFNRVRVRTPVFIIPA
jgi:lipoprotein-anchoring transpeptidase ErfK/SrfK